MRERRRGALNVLDVCLSDCDDEEIHKESPVTG